MSELDLIPAEYRLWIWQLSWLKRWAWMLGVILLLTLSTCMLLHQSTRRMREEVHTLEQRKNISLQQRQEIERLRAEHDATQHRLDALEAIRRSDPTISTLLAVDHAIADQSVWFQQWQYEKAEALPRSEAQPTRMTLTGQALDHAALSHFVEALLTERVIEDVRITRSALRHYVSSSVVDFEIVVTLLNPAAEVR